MSRLSAASEIEDLEQEERDVFYRGHHSNDNGNDNDHSHSHNHDNGDHDDPYEWFENSGESGLDGLDSLEAIRHSISSDSESEEEAEDNSNINAKRQNDQVGSGKNKKKARRGIYDLFSVSPEPDYQPDHDYFEMPRSKKKVGEHGAAQNMSFQGERWRGIHQSASASYPTAAGKDKESFRNENPSTNRKRICPDPFFVRTLGLNDLEAIMALEEQAYEEAELRSSRLELTYRLTVCPELCHGLFTIEGGKIFSDDGMQINMHPSLLKRTPKREVLLAIEIATKTDSTTVTKEAAKIPEWFVNKVTNAGAGTDTQSLSDSWIEITNLDYVSYPSVLQEVPTNLLHVNHSPTENYTAPTTASTIVKPSTARDRKVGHVDEGMTVILHSLAVLPFYRGYSLGRILLQDFLQRIQKAGIANNVAAVVPQHLVDYFEGFTFKVGHQSQPYTRSKKGVWYDMYLEMENLKNCGMKSILMKLKELEQREAQEKAMKELEEVFAKKMKYTAKGTAGD